MNSVSQQEEIILVSSHILANINTLIYFRM